MTASQWLPACEAEAIHAPGAIQSWGALLVAGAADGIVRHASANLQAIAGLSPQAALGQNLACLLPATCLAPLTTGGDSAAPVVLDTLPSVPGLRDAAEVACHRLDGTLVYEFEPVGTAPARRIKVGWRRARQVMDSLRASATVPMLFDAAVGELRRATGFDRAMLYRFGADGHGEVVAEDRTPDMEPFLGLHYPASDVPRQARRLYLRQRVRVIADVAAPPVGLLAVPGLQAADLSLSSLRAASPIHLEYLRRMGVRATIAISLVIDGALSGLLVCHHRGPFLVPGPARALCDLIGQVTAMMAGTLLAAEARAVKHANRARVEAIAARLAGQPDASSGLAETLAASGALLLGLCGAEGAIVRLAGRTVGLGTAPLGAAADSLLDALLALPVPDANLGNGADGSDVLATDQLSAVLAGRPADAAAAGALVLPLIHAPGDALVWLRPEQARAVRWGGNPNQPAEIDAATGRLSPRRSFAVWQQLVSGRARPWQAAELDAARQLRREIDRVLVRQAEADLARLRHHDPLTGLPNRRLLEDRLNHALTVAERQESALAVLFVDIDNFKRINDTLGHEVGDSLIKVFAERIWQSVRSMDTVARWGADDFVVVLENLGSPGEATSVGEKLIEAVGRPLHLGDNLLRIGASIGVALYPQDGKDVSTLLKNADLALFEAKNAGHDTLNFFDEEMNLRALRRLEIDAALRYGIEHGELELHYQPKVSVHDERLYGVEALVRWRRPGEGLIPPDNFIPWAEESGLIVDLGEWVLNEACQQIRRWQASGIGDIHVAVNVSPRQLRQAIQVERLIGIVEGSGVRPDLIELELTEACLMQDPDRTIEFLQTLRAQGFGIAIDDFGTGYSNLSYLRRLPVTTLKIDKSFVKDIEDDADDAEIIRTIIAMAKALGLGLVAEGVETPGQLAFLRDSACHVVQGYHFAKPMGPAAFAEWLIRFEAERRPSPNHEATQRLAPAYFMG